MYTGQIYTTETAETFSVVLIPFVSPSVPKGRKRHCSEQGFPQHREAEHKSFTSPGLVLPDLEAEPASINQGMSKDRHSNFHGIQQQDNLTEEGEMLDKMKNSAKLPNTDMQASFSESQESH